MRKAIDDTEIVSQLLFGESVVCIQEFKSHSLIQTADGYEGWIYSKCLVPNQYLATMVTSRNSVPIYKQKSILPGPLFYLPFGVGVKVIDSDSDWSTVELPNQEIVYLHSGNLSLKPTLDKHAIRTFGTQFLGIPYVWGGRSSFGFDCSGLAQMLYQHMGIALPRDSWQQAQDTRFQDVTIPEIGDLIFWGKSRNQISHVGVFLGEDQFIHSSIKEQKPWVRISNLSDPAWNCGANAVYPYRVYRTLS